MKNIAIFCDNLNVGGIQKSLINLLCNFDFQKENTNVDLYLYEKNNFYDQNIPSYVNVIYRKKFPFFSKFIYFNLLKKITKKIKTRAIYDIAIDFDSYQNYTALDAINSNAKVKIMWIHNDVEKKLENEKKYKILHHFFKSKYKYFDVFVGVSKGVIEPFKKVNKINNKSFLVIPNFIDVHEILNKSKEATDLIVNKDKYNLVSVGRLCHQKGYDILFEKINELRNYRDDFHLYIIGDGPEHNNLKSYVDNNKLNNYITFLGNQKNPFKYMNLMDGFILMSRYEGQGMVILEAKTLGLPVFIPKHLEKYIDDVEGYDDILEKLKQAKKVSKKTDMLMSYNNEIKKSIKTIMNIEKVSMLSLFPKIYLQGKNEYIEHLNQKLLNEEKTFVVTANPEAFMIAEKDSNYMNLLLDKSTEIIPDGVGLVKACQMLGYNSKERIPGIEVAEELLKTANKYKKKIYLFGSKEEVINSMLKMIKQQYPDIVISGAQNGYVSDKNDVFNKISKVKPDIVLVALGMPLQETLIYNNLNKFDKGIFIGVGGSFDVMSGSKKRAPKIFIKTNTEWLYRICCEPKRIKRFWNNNVKFLLEIKKYK